MTERVVSEAGDERLVDGAGFSATRLARIDHFFTVEVARGLTPGATLLIERKGRVVLRRAYGHRNRAAGVPMTLDAVFRIHSLSKPLVSLAAVMLAAEERLYLGQPVADILPAFADLRVLADGREVAPRRAPTIQDLLRHTAGFTYARNGGPVAALYGAAGIGARDLTNQIAADKLAALPLAHQPGTVWEYGHATDVLGRVIEVVAGRSLGAVLRQRIFGPLGMIDTGFDVAEGAHSRIAEPFAGDPLPDGRPFAEVRQPAVLESGGEGLVSTLADYAAFCRMLLAGGCEPRGVLLSEPSLRFVTADHIAPETGITIAPDSILEAGYGFGLGVAVRRGRGVAPFPGSPGELMWTGMAGQMFWVDPAEELLVVLLQQAPRQRLRHRAILKSLVYDALVGRRALKRERRARENT